MIYWPTKAPADQVDYGMDWAPTLTKMDDLTISVSAWALISGDVGIGAGAINAGLRSTVVRISAGTVDTEAVVRNTVTLSDGQIIHEDAFVKVRA